MGQVGSAKNSRKTSIPNKLYFRIGEVSDIVGVKPYVLRYWETEFPDIRPTKSKSGQRLYKRRDVELLLQVRELLYDERYTIDGAKQRLKEMAREHRGSIGGPSNTRISSSPVARSTVQQTEFPYDDSDFEDEKEVKAVVQPRAPIATPTVKSTTPQPVQRETRATAPYEQRPQQQYNQNPSSNERDAQYNQGVSARKLLLKLRHDLQDVLQELQA